jgi:exonuclease VII large subunit
LVGEVKSNRASKTEHMYYNMKDKRGKVECTCFQ